MLEQHSLQKPTSWHAGAVYTLVFFLCFCQSCQTITADPKEIKSHTWKEAFQFLGFNWTLTREIGGPYLNATPHRENPDQIALSKDVPLNVPGSNFKSFIFLLKSQEKPSFQLLSSYTEVVLCSTALHLQSIITISTT